MKTKILVIIISFIFLFTYTTNCFAVTNILAKHNVNKEVEEEIINEGTEDDLEEIDLENIEISEKGNELDAEDDKNIDLGDMDVNNDFNDKEINDNLKAEETKEDNVEQENNTEDEQKRGDSLIKENNFQMVVSQNEVGVTSYQGKIYIESPAVNQSFNTRTNGIKINVVGWAVSTDSNVTLQCLVDGKNTNASFTRVSRGDVDTLVSPSYGGTSATPKAGFNCSLDITTVTTGKHVIKIREISSNNQVICEYEVNVNIVNVPYVRKNVYRETNSKSKLYKA